MTYPDALAYLGQTRRFGMKLGLDPMRDLARALGNPQDGLRFIHLAGTNGKGSTAAFCESILRAAGLRVGLYTSPHLVSVRERIQIDRVPISEDDFAEGMAVVRHSLEKIDTHEATYFEVMTAMALWYFAREKVDWVVWETGLGGRLDATNIVTPKICIITNIGLEHQQYLGGTLAEIAAEKAGILKYGVPLVSAVEPGAAFEVVNERAKKERSFPTFVHRDMETQNLGLRDGKQWARIDENDYALGLLGPHQIYNAACAVEVMSKIRRDLIEGERERENLYSISDFDIERGLRDTVWPGRFEILSERPLTVLDGAHNPAGMTMLLETWRSFLASRAITAPTHLVFASVADKDISEIAQLLRPIAGKISLVRLANERTADPAQLAQSFTGIQCSCYDSVSALWPDLQKADPSSVTLITGSLFLVGEVLALRGGIAEEYQLNERLEKSTVSR